MNPISTINEKIPNGECFMNISIGCRLEKFNRLYYKTTDLNVLLCTSNAIMNYCHLMLLVLQSRISLETAILSTCFSIAVYTFFVTCSLFYLRLSIPSKINSLFIFR